MHADAPKLLWDAQQAVERIARFTQGKTWDDYQVRNVLIHGYATVDDRLVWGIVQAHLASLRGVLAHLLES